MLFDSIYFAIFLALVFMLYWKAQKKLRLQNILLLIASYYFYASWSYKFLFLLIFSTLLDFCTGIQISNTTKKNTKKIWFWLSVCVNLGFLGVFKYYNFFVESFSQGLSHFGIKTNYWSLRVILPVGISFYTFHGLSYVIDIYRGRIKPERNFIDYALFVSFFPLLVAGPIERAAHLLPQIHKKRTFDYTKAIDGLRQILWGLFKKMVIADNCAAYANVIFNNSNNYYGSTLILGAVFFAFQIYCDFSGYSDIAIGTAHLLGIDLLRNFAFPYFSRDIAEFWRRWHISLSTWFRDYLYIPLGGSKVGTWKKIRNVFIIFLISGFWHGANWTFIIWGFLNALYIMPSILFNKNRINLNTVAQGKNIPTPKEVLSIGLTFGLTVFAWIFFRSNSIGLALNYIANIFSGTFFHLPQFPAGTMRISTVILIILFFLVEWLGREQQFALAEFGTQWPKSVRYTMYYCIALCIILFSGSAQQFIYFQF
jgi:alginate O-acetyltransferase complex protein AlgI